MYSISEIVFRSTNKNALLLTSIFLTVALSSVAISFLQVRQNNKITDFQMRYIEYLPEGYQQNEGKYPLIIYLHGFGERGTAEKDLYKIKRWGVPYQVTTGHDMCFDVNGENLCFIALSPQTNHRWETEDIDKFIEFAKKTYRVDLDRIYLTGISMGGQQTWSYAYSSFNTPNKLAAISPIAGAGDPAKVCKIAKDQIPVWAFHVDQDYLIPLDSGKAAYDALLDCRPQANPDSHFTIYEYKESEAGGWKHNAWTRAYRTDNALSYPNLFQWLLSHKRNERSDVSVQILSKKEKDRLLKKDELKSASPHI